MTNTTKATFKTLLETKVTETLLTTANLSPIKRQEALEDTLNDLGSAKFLMNVDTDAEADSGYASRLLQDISTRTEAYLDNEYKNLCNQYANTANKRGAKDILFTILNTTKQVVVKRKDGTELVDRPVVTTAQLAYITTRHIINKVRSERSKTTSTAFGLVRDLNNTLDVDIKLSLLQNLAYKLVVMFCDCNDKFFSCVAEYADSKANNKEFFIKPTDAYVYKIESIIDDLAALQVLTSPMLCKPVDWNIENEVGGFVTEAYARPLVKGRGFKGVPQFVVNEVNHIQSIAYKINTDMLDLMTILDKTRPETLKKVYPVTPTKVSYEDCPHQDLEWADMTEDQKNDKRSFSAKMKGYRKSRDRKFSIDITMKNAMQQAKLFRDEAEIYFPHDLDYRQRAYNMVMSGINIQGSDGQKALVHFAKGNTIRTERGVYWMKVNLANFLGQDKLHVDDRVQWVDNNANAIKHQVLNRLTETEWHSWDKPMQGMALAIEYVQWLENPLTEFHTWLQLDGKCNSSQHLGTLARDHNVGKEVGLVDTGKVCGDIYTLVLEAVKVALTKSDDVLFRNQWEQSGLLVRNLCKTAVMTKAYNCELWGVKDGIKEYILEHGKTGCFSDMVGQSNKMGDLIWNSMDTTMSGVCQVMEWWEACSKVITKKNLPMKWTTPIGMECMHSPMKTKSKQIKVNVCGRTIRPSVTVNTDTINPAKAASSVAANITHSFDSSHLLLSNSKARSEVPTIKVSYVHDSFGCDYDNGDVMLGAARSSWVEQYGIDQLERLYQEWNTYLTDCGKNVQVPHPSEYIKLGHLNINEVTTSDWFFG